MVVQGRRWSAIVKAWEPFLAASLAGRLELHATHYRGAHDEEGRAWVTLDGEQILSVESLPYLMRVYGHSAELKAIGEDVQGAWDAAIEVAHREGLVYLFDFEVAVASYPDHRSTTRSPRPTSSSARSRWSTGASAGGGSRPLSCARTRARS